MVPRPGRGTFVAAPPARDGAARPRLAGGRARRPRHRGPAALMELLALAARGLARAQLRLPRPGAAADGRAGGLARARRRAAPARGSAAAIEGVGGAAGVVRARGGRALRRARRRDLPRRPGRARRPRVRGARAAAAATGARRVADLPRGARRRSAPPGLTPRARAERRRRRSGPELLADALERTGARVVYLQPLHANPHGADLAAERRAAVLEVAARGGRVPRRGRLGARPHHRRPGAGAAGGRRRRRPRRLRPLAEQVRLARAAVAAVAARGPAGARLRAARIVEDLFVSAPLQQAALELVSSPGWRRHLRRCARGCASAATRSWARSSATSARGALDRVPTGGLHLWLRLPEGTDEAALIAAAARAGRDRERLRAELRGRADRPAPAAHVRRRAARRPRGGRRPARRAALG